MSVTASRYISSASALRNRVSALEAEQEISDFLNGCYELCPWELSQEEANAIASNPGSHDALMERLSAQGKSAGARYIAARINSGAAPDLAQLAKDWWCHRAIKRELSEEELGEIGAGPMELRMLGVKTGYQARRFYELYKEVRVPNRVWGSSKQVSQSRVLAIASTPNFNRLPMWAKKGLVEHATYIHTERPGNIWRLLDCLKAWKWESCLPKGIAEKVGRMGLKGRVIAALAWQDQATLYWQRQREGYDRSVVVDAFWSQFRRFERMPLVALLPRLQDFWRYQPGKLRCIIEGWLELPHQALKTDAIADIIATYGNPREACQHLFGITGKATVKAFQACQSKDAWRWASALGDRNPDAIQKILGMSPIIEFQSDAVEFLRSLPMVSRLRLLQATEFKYRGQVQSISADHIRDTGYLWSNIQNKPDLGRIRCWFSVHEQLAAFVKELPDEALPIPAGWERIDGLCAVDGAWELEFPKRVATLKYYGQTLNNCVGGYGPAIKSGRSVIFVVREYGQLTHCVEVSNGYINQFYKSGNRPGDVNVQRSVEAALQQAGLI